MFKWMQKLLIPVVACLIFQPGAWAAYPERPIRIIVGFPPGTAGDVIARILSPKLAELNKQTVLVENRPGAGSNIAAEAVARSPADGYTLLISTTANVINAAVSPALKFDFTRDLVPVMMIAENPVLLVASPNFPGASVADLVGAAKSAPARFAFASSGNGTFTHLYGELFGQTEGIRLTHVPYKGSSQALTDVMSNVVDLAFMPSTPVIAQANAGKVKPLAVIGKRRLPALPNVPTFTEAGVPGMETALWFGLHAPAGTPRPIIDKLAADLRTVLSMADVKSQLAAQSIDLVGAGPAEFGEQIARESAQWAKVVKAAGVKAD
jgi:tripartite-type tricarboxylate transporter receptor subunit TctC